MALTKSHLIEAIAEQNGFTKKKSTETGKICPSCQESILECTCKKKKSNK